MNPSFSKKALIIGISGQDGAHLAALLLSKGYEVHGTSRDTSLMSRTSLNGLKLMDRIQFHSLNTKDFRNILEVLSRVKPDEIYNLAGQSSVGLSFDQPLETFDSIAVANLNLLEAVRFFKLTARLYHAGSSECFGNTPKEGADETTHFRPESPYAIAKAAAFWQVANYRRAFGLFACSGILFNHESNFRTDRFVTKKIIKAAVAISRGKQKNLELGNISIRRDWGWAPDYVEAMWRMLQTDHPDDYVVATGVNHSLEEFVKEAFRCVDLDYREYLVTHSQHLRPSDISHSLGNPKKIQTELGWKPKVSFSEIIQQMIQYELDKEGHSA